MKQFRQALAALQPKVGERRWVYVPYDQLTDRIGPLADAEPADVGIVLVESLAKPRRRPYHKQKLALLLTNMRHFALEQAERGVAVDYRAGEDDYATQLTAAATEHGTLVCMRPAERELRAELAPLVTDGLLSWVDHEGWLTSSEDFRASAGKTQFRMDAFYRFVRRKTGVLMDDGSPAGGQFSFDGDNRERWDGTPEAPELPRFDPNAITLEVGEMLISGVLKHHPGTLDLAAIAATRVDAERWWQWAKDCCMTDFGPYEDAMSTKSATLFHTRISPLLNLHRVLPQQVVEDVEALDIPLNSKEGFIRQVLGWREFVHHVHEVTDGFRVLPKDPAFTGLPFEHPTSGVDDGAQPTVLDGDMDLPPTYWEGAPSGLACLDTSTETVWATGHSHHITRLMVLSNIARLLDVSPRQLTDWFWVAYDDAFDWVVEPNVLAMGTFAVGGVMTTKPYVSGSNYIHKMSDYCKGCAFHPKKTCPITPLYWSFLGRNAEAMGKNHRMGLIMGSFRRRSDAKKDLDQRTYQWVRKTLVAGKVLRPADAPE
jgi:deoxyribodipyrimidine photolyase-related protein